MLLDQEKKLSTKEILGKVGSLLFTQFETEFAKFDSIENNNKGPVHSFISKNYVDYAIVVQLSHLMITTGVNEGQQYGQLAQAIGDRVANYYGSRLKENNSIQLGAWILNAYAILDLIIVKLVNVMGNKTQTVYKVYAGNKGKLQQLKKEFDEKSDPYKPLLQQAPDWEYGTIKNEIGEPIKLIKDANIDTLSKLNPHNTPIVLNAINKKQKIAFVVDDKVFETYKWALENNENSFEHNSVETIEIDRKIAKKAEAKSIMEAAEPYLGKTFYQQYQADNRGRLYPLSAYLNELNSDNAKGMIKFATGAELGSTGKEELFHHISNMFGNDKVTHNERVKFVEDNFDKFADCGMYPKVNKSWMDAEEPFQFLQSCIELDKLRTHLNMGDTADTFVSHTICYRDGSNNGLQWLFSLARDEINAHLVNVKPTTNNKPGDMYAHVAKAVVLKIAEKIGEQEAIAFENYDLYFKTIEKLRNRCRIAELNNDPKAENKRKLISWYQRRYKEQLKTTDLLYWNKANFDPKVWRKIVKRNVMTYGYSATKQGMGEQIIQDTRDIDNQYLSNKQHSAARLLGSMVYNTIEEEFPKVSATMKLFKDNCGAYMKSGRQYGHTTLISNFPFVQKYLKQTNSRVVINNVYVTGNDYKTKTFQTISVRAKFNTNKPNVQKAKSGISPNTIHNLDSLHLMLVIDACNFDIVSAHDSYGSRAGDIQVLNKIIREQFKRIIDQDPISNILNQTGNLVDPLVSGTLDSSEILNSEFAFA